MSFEFIIILCIIMLVLSLIIERNVYNPITIFSLLWVIVISFYKINPYALPTAKANTEFSISLGITCFFVGAFLFGNLCIRNNKISVVKHSKNQKKIYNDIFNNDIVIILQIIAFVILTFTASYSIRALLSGTGLWYVRYHLRTQILNTGLFGTLITYLAEPIMFFSIPYSVLNVLQGDPKKVISNLLTVLITLLDLLTNGGRVALLYSLICVICIPAILNSQNPEKQKTKRESNFQMLLIAIILILIMIYILIDRGSDIIRSTIIYLYAPIDTFDRYVSIFNSDSYDFTKGFLSFQGFLRPVFLLLGLADIDIIQNVEKVYNLIDSAIYLGTIRFNSSATVFGYFYFDFGLPGIIGGSILFGFICQKAYVKIALVDKIKSSSICWYMMLLGSVALSFISFMFASPSYALAWMMIIVLKGKYYRLGKKKRK